MKMLLKMSMALGVALMLGVAQPADAVTGKANILVPAQNSLSGTRLMVVPNIGTGTHLLLPNRTFILHDKGVIISRIKYKPSRM